MRRPSTPIIISVLALVAATGSYAGVNPVAAVTQLIDGGKIKRGSITGKQIKKKTLTKKHFKKGTLRRGPQGERGPQGPQGPQGLQGVKGDTGSVDVSLLGTSITVTGLGFHALDGDLDETFGPGFGIVHPSTPGTRASAHLQLPDGAVVESLSLNARDDDGGNDIVVNIGGVDPSGVGSGIVTQLDTSSGAPSSEFRTFDQQVTAGPDAVIDNAAFGYFLFANFQNGTNDDLLLGSVRVSYSLPAP